MIVYKVTNKINNKVYIGQTSFPLEVRKHKHESVRNTGYYFHNAIKKYGKEKFEWKILCTCESEEKLYKKEKYYIRKYKSSVRGHGYNMTEGGEGPLGRRHTEITKKRMSLAKIGKRFPHTPEWNKKIGLAQIGNKNHMYGKVGAKHHGAKKYVVITPKDYSFVVHGLQNFCLNYKEAKLYSPLLNLCALGKRNHHKGYKCRYYDENLDGNLSMWGGI